MLATPFIALLLRFAGQKYDQYRLANWMTADAPGLSKSSDDNLECLARNADSIKQQIIHNLTLDLLVSGRTLNLWKLSEGSSVKLKLFPLLILFAILIGAPKSYAFTDCVYKVQKMYVSLESNGMVYVHLMNSQGQNTGAIFKNNTMVSEEILGRFHAQILSAKLSDHAIIVRFPETGADCSAMVSPARGDFIGVWVQDP